MAIEARIQRNIRATLKQHGCLVYKMEPPPTGVPDLMVIYAPGQHFWIEVKQPGNYPSPVQRAYHQYLNEFGETVYVCRNTTGAIEALAEVRRLVQASENCLRPNPNK